MSLDTVAEAISSGLDGRGVDPSDDARSASEKALKALGDFIGASGHEVSWQISDPLMGADSVLVSIGGTQRQWLAVTEAVRDQVARKPPLNADTCRRLEFTAQSAYTREGGLSAEELSVRRRGRDGVEVVMPVRHVQMTIDGDVWRVRRAESTGAEWSRGSSPGS